jgi:carboxymethylenebutenolidase
VYGDQDFVMPPDQLDDVRAGIDLWGVEAEVRRCAGAGHPFSAAWGPMGDVEADGASWEYAVSFARAYTNPWIS